MENGVECPGGNKQKYANLYGSLSFSHFAHSFLEKAPSNGFDIIKKPCKVEMTLNQNDKKRNIQMSISREPKLIFYFLIFSPRHPGF